jgi:hypothetical protein
VRNCDPGADERLPSDRASRCWNDDLVSRWLGELPGLCAPSWQIVSTHERDRRPPQFGGVEGRLVIVSAVTAHTGENFPNKGILTHQRRFQRSFTQFSVDSGLPDIERAALFESVSAPQRIASFYDFFRSFVSWNARWRNPARNVEISLGFWHRNRLRVTPTLLQNVPRTHSSLRVSHEKRNVDECPPTRGKSNRHR